MNALLLILAGAVVIDRILGEPPNRFHPTAWLGRVIGGVVGILKNSIVDGGFIFLIATVPATYLSIVIIGKVGAESMAGIVLASLILKLQFSWKALGEHAESVGHGLSVDIKSARKAVSQLVGRDADRLDEEHIISATVESIGESSVDGIIAPLFYYLIFGVVFGTAYGVGAAVFYRAVNTLDSMIGYKKGGYHWLGFFSAKIDDVLNFIPARIASVLLIVAAAIAKEDARGAFSTYLRDRGNTESPNSGHSMSAMAGALGVQLEKIGFHKLGDPKMRLKREHIGRAVRLVDASVLSFLGISLVILII